MNKINLDNLDRKLLNELQINAHRTNAELGGVVGLSAAAVLRRLKKLRDEGIIERTVALIAPEVSEHSLTAISEVSLKRHGTDERDRFLKQMSAQPAVTQCYLVTGDIDVVIIASFANIMAFDAFVERCLACDPGIEQVRTHFVMRRVKFLPQVTFAGVH
jgi:Lrp/AsnC family transcriptional regulator, leucine-responsive regulatory protein